MSKKEQKQQEQEEYQKARSFSLWFFFMAGSVGIVCAEAFLDGNFWFSEDRVLRELKVDHPGVTEILKIKRNVISQSVITVSENGGRRDYCLDTNIL